MPLTRRDVIRYASATLALVGCGRERAQADPEGPALPQGGPDAGRVAGEIPRRPLGRSGVLVSAMGLGGSHLGAMPNADDAVRVVHAAIDAGVTFFDNAWEYHDGRSEEVLGRALAGKRDGVFLMTKVCTHGRGAEVAMAQLEDSLRRLKTDHLDLWQVHECVYDNDPERHYASGGVLEALSRAREQGKVRLVGFTGHKDPKIHLAMLEGGYPFDTAQLPLNGFDASFRSFEQRVVPELVKRQMGVIGMKSLGGLGGPVRAGAVRADEALRYAMSIPGVSVTVSGVDSLDVLEQNLAVARGFVPMSDAERAAFRERTASLAADGHLELYKTTTFFDGKEGREQHGFPPHDALPL